MEYMVIDVGGTYIKYALMTEECEFVEKGRIPSVCDPVQVFIDTLVEIIRKYEDRIAGVALSMPGIIDSQNGFMYTGGYISCIANLNIVETLSQYCSVPITVENDAKCAALAEVWRGALADCRDAVVIVCGTGIGGAVIQNRKVLKGHHFMAGEFSYPIVQASEPFNLDYAFGFSSGIAALIKLAAEKTGIAKEELNGEVIFAMANCGDEAALAALREYSRSIALQINNYQFILDPERIAVGGGISIQPLFLQLIKEELREINKAYEPWKIPLPEVVNCHFFNDANLIGALYFHLCIKEQELLIE